MVSEWIDRNKSTVPHAWHNAEGHCFVTKLQRHLASKSTKEQEMTWPTRKLEPKQGESGIVEKKTETANEVLYFVLWDCAESNKRSNSLVSKFANRCFFFKGSFSTVRLLFNIFGRVLRVAHTGMP